MLLPFHAHKGFGVIAVLIYLVIPVLCPAQTTDHPFNNAANWGGTGLMEVPTARILNDGELRVGFAQASPFRWIAGGMGVFPGIEFSGRYTEIMNIDSGLGADFGANKDKAFDLKFQILPESRRFPAIAVGVNDFHGTKVFASEYLVFSRQIFPIDFTFGIGHKRLAGRGGVPISDSLGLFGGFEWALHRTVHFMAEYNPIKYEEDEKSVRGVPEGADSPVNVGLRFKFIPGVDLGVSYQRGDQIGVMGHMQIDLGQPMMPKRSDPPLRTPMDRRGFNRRDMYKMVNTIRGAVETAGMQEVVVYTDGKSLVAEFENEKYISQQKAVGRVLRILLFYSPADTDKLVTKLKRRRMPVIRFSIAPRHLEEYLLGNVPDRIFKDFISIETISPKDNSTASMVAVSDKGVGNRFDYGVKPSVETWLNDPSGIFKGKVGIKPYFDYGLWEGADVTFRYDIPFYSNIESSNELLPNPVRSDAWLYSDDDVTIDRLIFDQVFKISERTFGRMSMGYFEKMYAGFGAEVLTFLFSGDLAIGVEADWVKKREPGKHLELMDRDAHTILGNAYYHLSPIDTTIHTQYGRFLAGDIGWRFDFSRQYENGVVIGFWYSATDTDDFKDEYNKGYHDKGVFMKIPTRMLTTYETRRKYNYSLSPWTRDVAASVHHWSTLFDFGFDMMPGRFKRNVEKFKE